MPRNRITKYHNRIEKQIYAAERQTKILGTIHSFLLDHIQHEDNFSIVCFDSALYKTHLTEEHYYAWTTLSMDLWLKRNQQILLDVKRSIIYRCIFVPTFESVDPGKRQLLKDVISFNFHLHMWHGIILCVIFLDPKQFPPSLISKKFDVTSIPNQNVVILAKDFYESDTLNISQMNDKLAHDRLNEMRLLIKQSGTKPILLWYDEDNFSPNRMRGARWEMFRRLYLRMEAGSFVCTRCLKRKVLSEFELDHILPIADGHKQTIVNLQGICKSCNCSKGAGYEKYNPFCIPAYVPPYLRNESLLGALTKDPEWLGKISRPRNMEEAMKVFL